MSASAIAPSSPSLGQVDFASQFVLWAARQWIGLSDPSGVAARRLAGAFSAARAPAALAALDALLATLARDSRRALDFRAAGDLDIGRDERALLELLRRLQSRADLAALRDNPDACGSRLPARREVAACCEEVAAMLVALGWCGVATARALVGVVARLAGELVVAGLWIGAGAGPARTSGAARVPGDRRALH